MTARSKHVSVATTKLAPIVLFGIDSRGKPKGARFGKEHAGLATKAASQMDLRILASDNPMVSEIAAKLPVGRVHGNGRTFVPFIKQELYDKLLAAVPTAKATAASAAPSNGMPGPTSGGSSPRLPRSWKEIAIGDLVVAHQSPDIGWYEAIVVQVSGDMLTLRWRDYPKEQPITRHRLRVGLLYPGNIPKAETVKPAKSAEPSKQDKSATAGSATGSQGLPKTWDEIDAGHLVLAKDDGPWRTWWEAIPLETTASDTLKMRWRDQIGATASITRPRFDLALICPDAA